MVFLTGEMTCFSNYTFYERIFFHKNFLYIYKMPRKSAKVSRKKCKSPRSKPVRKSVRKSPKKSVRKSPTMKSKDDMYHVSLRLTFDKKNTENPPTHKEFIDHLKKYFKKDLDGVYLLVDYNDRELMKNISLTNDKLTFDVPKSISNHKKQIVSNEALKKFVLDYGHFGDTVYGSGPNFWEMRDETSQEFAEIYPTSVVVK
jgi:hypothetical protein